MKFNTVSEVQEHLKQHGFSDVILPSAKSQDSSYRVFVVIFSEDKESILVIPCNQKKIIGDLYRDQLIPETKEQTVLRALYNEVGVTTTAEDLHSLSFQTLMLQNQKQRHYLYVVKSFYGQLKGNFPDNNQGEPFFFPLKKIRQILTDDQQWIIFKIKEYRKKNPL